MSQEKKNQSNLQISSNAEAKGELYKCESRLEG